MQSDADRFRRGDPGPVAEQAPPAAGDGTRAQPQATPPRPGPQQRYAPPQATPPRPGPQQRYAPPQYGMPQYGAGQYGAGQYGGPGQSYARYAPPQPGVRFAPPAFEGHDAPLIHPAAAQASSATPYGVPVYRTPVYTYAPHPQRGLSITALVLGLCSFLFAWTLVVVPMIGIVFGVIALRREPAGKAMAAIGLVASVFGLLWVLLFYLLPLMRVLGAMLSTVGG